MRNVEIRNERNALLRRYRELSIAEKNLEQECLQFGPGKYIVTWPASKNQGDGKPRKRYKQRREIYVYDDDADGETLPAVAEGSRGGVTIYAPRAGGRPAITADDIRSVMQEALKPITERLKTVESNDEDEEEYDDEDEEEETPEHDFLEKLLTIARKPVYRPLVVSLLSTEPDEVKFRAIDVALAENGDAIKHELFTDALSLLPKDLVGIL